MRRWRAGLSLWTLVASSWALSASGAATLSLETVDTCVSPAQTVTVQVRMSNLSVPAAGFQAFLGYDATKLTFLNWSYSSSPFGLPLINQRSGCVTGDACVNPIPGVINLSAGINIFAGQQPSQADAVLASLTFTASAVQTATRITFRAHEPPAQLTQSGGEPIKTTLVSSPFIHIALSAVDSDGDGVPDACDNCPPAPNAAQADADADGVGDACDACPNTIPDDPAVDAQGCPPFNPVDFDNDGDVDEDDLAVLLGCRSGPNIPRAATAHCARSDLDSDNDVDSDDFGRFQRSFSGANRAWTTLP